MAVFRIDVWHNVAVDEDGRHPAWVFGYRPEHPIVKVAQWTVEADSPEQACESAYRLGNIGDDPTFGTPDPQALAYRAAKNRSLCVGDVIVFDGAVAYAYAPVGVERVRLNPEQVSTVSVYGSTWHAGQPYQQPVTA